MAEKKKKKTYKATSTVIHPPLGVSDEQIKRWEKQEAKKTVVVRKPNEGHPGRKAEAKFFLRRKRQFLADEMIPLKGSEKAQRQAFEKCTRQNKKRKKLAKRK